MKNKEKYRHELLKPTQFFCRDFIKSNVLVSYGINCEKIECEQCKAIVALWLEEECEDTKVDWENVPVDTKILVTNHDDVEPWIRRYFAKFEDGFVCAFKDGRTSWNSNETESWKHAKLAEDEE